MIIFQEYIYQIRSNTQSILVEIMSEYLQILLQQEQQRQDNTIELIASENFVSKEILNLLGSCLTNKYAEGYPELQRYSGRKNRYYGGCRFIDIIEEYCCDMWRKVYNTDYHVNVQPHSGSQANMAAYASVLNYKDSILSMSLASGGHLSHGSLVNFSGKYYDIYSYSVDNLGYIDYEDLKHKLIKIQPKLLLAGASAYPRKIPFSYFKQLIDKYSPNTIFMVDMAHIAGLIAGDVHESPFGIADIITTTTHKTLRGPRGGLIFCKKEYANKIDGAVFPFIQGGPLENVIAAKAQCAEEAITNEYKDYIMKVVENTQAMCNYFIQHGYKVVTNGTDNHLFVIDFSQTHPNITGKQVQQECEKYNITLNKNCVPNEKRKPTEASGVRIGCAAMTTKGFSKNDFIKTAEKIDEIINKI